MACNPNNVDFSDLQPSGWRKLRNIVQWVPFFQTYKKQRYPWVQLAGHQGNFKAGPDQGTILKKLCSKEEKCFKVSLFIQFCCLKISTKTTVGRVMSLEGISFNHTSVNILVFIFSFYTEKILRNIQ